MCVYIYMYTHQSWGFHTSRVPKNRRTNSKWSQVPGWTPKNRCRVLCRDLVHKASVCHPRGRENARLASEQCSPCWLIIASSTAFLYQLSLRIIISIFFGIILGLPVHGSRIPYQELNGTTSYYFHGLPNESHWNILKICDSCDARTDLFPAPLEVSSEFSHNFMVHLPVGP